MIIPKSLDDITAVGEINVKNIFRYQIGFISICSAMMIASKPPCRPASDVPEVPLYQRRKTFHKLRTKIGNLLLGIHRCAPTPLIAMIAAVYCDESRMDRMSCYKERGVEVYHLKTKDGWEIFTNVEQVFGMLLGPVLRELNIDYGQIAVLYHHRRPEVIKTLKSILEVNGSDLRQEMLIA